MDELLTFDDITLLTGIESHATRVLVRERLRSLLTLLADREAQLAEKDADHTGYNVPTFEEWKSECNDK